MRVPNIVADPADAFGVSARTLTEGFQTEGDIFVIFRQMRMQIDSICPGQVGRLSHQVSRNAEGRTGRHHDPQH